MISNPLWISCRILSISTKELQTLFDVELPNNLRQPPSYARNFLEFCSFKALHLAITRPNYLIDKEFCHLTFDMMVAWEDPHVDSNLIDNVWLELIFLPKILRPSHVIVCIFFVLMQYCLDFSQEDGCEANSCFTVTSLSLLVSWITCYCRKLFPAAIRMWRVKMVGHCSIPTQPKWLFRWFYHSKEFSNKFYLYCFIYQHRLC